MKMQRGRVLYGTKKEGWKAITPGGTKVDLPVDGGRIRDDSGARKPGPAEKNPHPIAEDLVEFIALGHDGETLIAHEWVVLSPDASL